MQAEIITIGDELLIGQTIDTNSAWLSRALNEIGIEVLQISSISDKEEKITGALKESLSRSDLVILTGGLGPTNDDITKNTLTEFFGGKLVFNETVFQWISQLFSTRGLDVNELNRAQAEVPDNCIPLHNEQGTAPGMWFEQNDKVTISLPGVPYEMEGLMEKEAIPRLKEHFKTPTILHQTILTYGTYEAKLAEMLSPVEEKLPGHIKLAYLPTYGVIKLRLSTTGLDRQKLLNDLEGAKDEIVKVVGDYVFGYDSDSLEAAVGKELKIRGKKMATAESCTGGKIANLITSVPGSSEYFEGSVIAYSNNIKSQILNVDSDVIQGHGAVSREVVEQMARGVLHRFNVDYAISTSGIAGPGGGTEEKPVGTTWIAVAGNEKVISKKFHFGSHRERNIYRASLTGLNMLRKLIQKEIK